MHKRRSLFQQAMALKLAPGFKRKAVPGNALVPPPKKLATGICSIANKNDAQSVTNLSSLKKIRSSNPKGLFCKSDGCRKSRRKGKSSSSSEVLFGSPVNERQANYSYLTALLGNTFHMAKRGNCITVYCQRISPNIKKRIAKHFKDKGITCSFSTRELTATLLKGEEDGLLPPFKITTKYNGTTDEGCSGTLLIHGDSIKHAKIYAVSCMHVVIPNVKWWMSQSKDWTEDKHILLQQNIKQKILELKMVKNRERKDSNKKKEVAFMLTPAWAYFNEQSNPFAADFFLGEIKPVEKLRRKVQDVKISELSKVRSGANTQEHWMYVKGIFNSGTVDEAIKRLKNKVLRFGGSCKMAKGRIDDTERNFPVKEDNDIVVNFPPGSLLFASCQDKVKPGHSGSMVYVEADGENIEILGIVVGEYKVPDGGSGTRKLTAIQSLSPILNYLEDKNSKWNRAKFRTPYQFCAYLGKNGTQIGEILK